MESYFCVSLSNRLSLQKILTVIDVPPDPTTQKHQNQNEAKPTIKNPNRNNNGRFAMHTSLESIIVVSKYP